MTTPSNIPIPDPSVLTTEQSERLRDELTSYIDGQIAIINERLLAVHLVPTEGSVRELAHLKELTAVQFGGVDQRFAERDIRAEREARDNKTAVDAAFAAQKEAAAAQNQANSVAISKSEAATKEALVKLGEAGDASRQALSDRIDATKDTIATLERTLTARISDVATATSNAGASRAGGKDATASIVTLVLVAIAVIGLLIKFH